MTIKQLCRKRNKLVMLATKLRGEEKHAVDIAVYLIDMYLDGELSNDAETQLNTIFKYLNISK